MSLLDIRYEVLESKIAKSVCNVCETMVGEKGLFTGSEDLSKTQISTPRFGDDAEGGHESKLAIPMSLFGQELFISIWG